MNGKSIGKGLFAKDTGDKNEIIFHKDDYIIDYDGEIIDEIEQIKRYGSGTAPYCIGGNFIDGNIIGNSPFIDAAFMRSAGSMSNHMPQQQSNAQYEFDGDRNAHIIVAIKNIYSGEEIFCNYGDEYEFDGHYCGKHATLSSKKRVPKWYK